MTTTINKLEAIRNKYCNVRHNDDNYSIGGGLADPTSIDGQCMYCGCTDGHYVGCARPAFSKFASKRHEDAKNDAGKLTLGEATQLFKKATGLDTDSVRELIEYAVPNMEWHHAGKLPKAYGGGMKKTYFVKAQEICDIATNWDSYLEKLSASKIAAKIAADNKRLLEEKRDEFLKANAKQITRVSSRPNFFFQTAREMNGKYGWFDSTYKNYNLTEYYSGFQFESEEKYREFLNIK